MRWRTRVRIRWRSSINERHAELALCDAVKEATEVIPSEEVRVEDRIIDGAFRMSVGYVVPPFTSGVVVKWDGYPKRIYPGHQWRA